MKCRKNSQNLVDNLAVVVIGRVAASIRRSTCFGIGAFLDNLDPRIGEACICELVDTSSGVGPSIIGVASDNDSSVLGIAVDVAQNLVDSCRASVDISRVGST